MSLLNENFYLNKVEPTRACLLAMRDIVLNLGDNITETTKYGMPCFTFKNKAFCYLWIDKKSAEPYYLLVDGKVLNHPILESGERSRMKILRVNSNKDLPISTIKEVLGLAISYRKSQ